MWWVLTVLAVPRIQPVEIDGELQAIQIHDTASTFVVEPYRVETSRDWADGDLPSVGMRRWEKVVRLRERASVLARQDLAGWLSSARQSLPEGDARAWMAVAASLAGDSLDDELEAEVASQSAARFRQSRAAQPIGLLALPALEPTAEARAWLRSPAPPGLREQLSAPLRTELDTLREGVQAVIPGGDPDALLPMGDDPLLALIQPAAPATAPPETDGTGVPVQPQLLFEPCPSCDPTLIHQQTPGELPLLLVPERWTARNRPVMVGFVGIEVVHARIHYRRAPAVTLADGTAVDVQPIPQLARLARPRFVRVELSRLVAPDELEARFSETLDLDAGLADLLPPETRWCSCAHGPVWWALPATLLFIRVRGTPPGRKNGHRLHRANSEQRRTRE